MSRQSAPVHQSQSAAVTDSVSSKASEASAKAPSRSAIDPTAGGFSSELAIYSSSDSDDEYTSSCGSEEDDNPFDDPLSSSPLLLLSSSSKSKKQPSNKGTTPQIEKTVVDAKSKPPESEAPKDMDRRPPAASVQQLESAKAESDSDEDPEILEEDELMEWLTTPTSPPVKNLSEPSMGSISKTLSAGSPSSTDSTVVQSSPSSNPNSSAKPHLSQPILKTPGAHAKRKPPAGKPLGKGRGSPARGRGRRKVPVRGSQNELRRQPLSALGAAPKRPPAAT